MDKKYSTTNNDEKSQKERLGDNDNATQKDASTTPDKKEFPIPTDLIEDLDKGKIDPLTEGNTNLGYEEKSPRKKELDQKEHLDRDDK
ncbi:hypothetical protein SGQ44_16640 [Flavobacterium sp. Fl-77]|uniref:Uncharacterized protein n=1 Tax=Flavobacterium flavipigmentatum TaxID=2893884 RepID=A0AAJ2SFC1_9FLAO|nr:MULTISPECIES: hypothetical protein [unclassified Flavobacterium]MDX6183864.1 hypothetical protein [Flavobacterium sp. Fl-33]MDX6187391.1 hypothetical protein [Flavobacterium sp. Fl-77]UFH40295.1 hypothetical protein LNP22_08455 [Flavobacterium sp. F-70]